MLIPAIWLGGVCRAQATAWRALSKVASDAAAFLTSTWSGCDSFSWLWTERELNFFSFFLWIQSKAYVLGTDQAETQQAKQGTI